MCRGEIACQIFRCSCSASGCCRMMARSKKRASGCNWNMQISNKMQNEKGQNSLNFVEIFLCISVLTISGVQKVPLIVAIQECPRHLHDHLKLRFVVLTQLVILQDHEILDDFLNGRLLKGLFGIAEWSLNDCRLSLCHALMQEGEQKWVNFLDEFVLLEPESCVEDFGIDNDREQLIHLLVIVRDALDVWVVRFYN